MKKITLSLMTIAVVLVMVVAATTAYFSDQKVVSGNTFTSGTVTLGNVSGMPVNVTLVPGKSVTKTVGVEYTGSINADIYVGNRGNACSPTEDMYFADKLWVTIAEYGNPGVVYFNNYANILAGSWSKIASNTGAGYKWYNVTFTLDSSVGNEYQGKTNDCTEFVLYAVQPEGSAPATAPYLTSGPGPW